MQRRAIALDYLPAVQHPPGMGRYVRELVRALVRLDGPPELVLFEGGLGPRPMEGAPLGLVPSSGQRARVRRRRLPLPRRALDLLARAGLGADRLCGRIGLFHRVHALHPPVSASLTTLALAELAPRGSEADARIARAARDAARVFVFGAPMRRQVLERYDLDPDAVILSPVGSEHWERDLAGEAVTRSDPPVLLALGAIRRARRPLELLAGFESLRARGGVARLVFCGRSGDAGEALRAALARSPVADDVDWLDEPRERDMPRLVASASALVHLAEDEGTPVTVLEAARMGPLVLAEDLEVLRDALGDDGLWWRRGEDLADALACTLEAVAAEDTGDSLTGGRGARLRQRAAGATWETVARVHRDAWSSIL